MRKITCAFTGHRPSKLSFGFDEEHEKCVKLKQVLREQIVTLIQSGVSTFLSGMDLGTDLWCSEIVLELKRHYPNIRLTAVKPCENQADKWSIELRERYFNALAVCDNEILISTRYTDRCMLERDHYLVDNADCLLAVYDGHRVGGKAYTVKYARAKEKPIFVIRPDTLQIVSPDEWDFLVRRSQLRLIK